MSEETPLPPGQLKETEEPLRKIRFFSQEYADIAKLRDLAQKEAYRAMKLKHRAATYVTAMEKHRHKATILKEKAAHVLGKIPSVKDRMVALEEEIKVGAQALSSGGVRPRDQSKLRLKIRGLQEKVATLEQRVAKYESRATHHLSISSQKKVRATTFEERAKAFENNANELSTRADRVQKATEADATNAGHT